MKRLIKKFREIQLVILSILIVFQIIQNIEALRKSIAESLGIRPMVKNWTFRKVLYNIFLRKICILMLTKFN